MPPVHRVIFKVIKWKRSCCCCGQTDWQVTPNSTAVEITAIEVTVQRLKLEFLTWALTPCYNKIKDWREKQCIIETRGVKMARACPNRTYPKVWIISSLLSVRVTHTGSGIVTVWFIWLGLMEHIKSYPIPKSSSSLCWNCPIPSQNTCSNRCLSTNTRTISQKFTKTKQKNNWHQL